MDYTILPSLIVSVTRLQLIDDNLAVIRREINCINDQLAKTAEALKYAKYDYDVLNKLEKILAEISTRDQTISSAILSLLGILELRDSPTVQQALLDGGIQRVLTKHTAGLKIAFIHKVSHKPLLEVDLRF